MTEELFQMVDSILQDHAPSERQLFAVAGRPMIATRLESFDLPGEPAALSFAPEIEAGLLFVHLVAGTLAVVESYLSARRVKEEKELSEALQKLWEERLIRSNVPPALARLASQQRGPELLRILDNDSIQTPSE